MIIFFSSIQISCLKSLYNLEKENGDYKTANIYLEEQSTIMDSLYCMEQSTEIQQLVYEYNTKMRVQEEHPRHAGDLPPVLGNDGTAWMEIYTGRFYPMDVVGRTIVLHEMPDDFKTQPSGDSGMKIACGEIKAWEQECKNKNGNE